MRKLLFSCTTGIIKCIWISNETFGHVEDGPPDHISLLKEAWPCQNWSWGGTVLTAESGPVVPMVILLTPYLYNVNCLWR